MGNQLQFRLCELCWRSRSLLAFMQRHPICKECKKAGLISHRLQYYANQKIKLPEERLRICTLCIQEKLEIENFEIDKRTNDYRSECKKCRNKRQADNRKDRGLTKEQKDRRNKLARERTSKKRIADPIFAAKLKKYDQERRIRKLSLIDLMPDDWWNILLEICEYRCLSPRCNKKINERNPLSHDHVIPVSIEGSIHSLGNSQVLCLSCNSSKKNRNSDDYRTQEMKQKLEAYDQLKLNSDIDIVL